MNNASRHLHITRTVQATTANPGVGNYATIATPGYISQRLACLSFLFTTEVTVASRNLRLEWHRGALQRVIGLSPHGVAASSTCYFLAGRGGLNLSILTNVHEILGASFDMDFQPTDTLEIVVANMQANDALTLITHWWDVFY